MASRLGCSRPISTSLSISTSTSTSSSLSAYGLLHPCNDPAADLMQGYHAGHLGVSAKSGESYFPSIRPVLG